MWCEWLLCGLTKYLAEVGVIIEIASGMSCRWAVDGVTDLEVMAGIW